MNKTLFPAHVCAKNTNAFFWELYQMESDFPALYLQKQVFNIAIELAEKLNSEEDNSSQRMGEAFYTLSMIFDFATAFTQHELEQLHVTQKKKG